MVEGNNSDQNIKTLEEDNEKQNELIFSFTFL